MDSPDILILSDRVRNTISLLESHFREFKTALRDRPNEKKPRIVREICSEIGEALVAFANADGGAILIGVEDNGTVTGVPHNEVEVANMLKAPKTHIYQGQTIPLVYATELQIDNKKVLYFEVSKGTTQVYQLPDGRCVKRKDKETIPATFNDIKFERQEVRSREYGNEFQEGATATDLDIELLQGISNDYIHGLSVERYLQQVGLAEYALNGLRLRKAALLLFAKNINRWHPRCQVRILKINGNRLGSGEAYNVISDDYITGNIFELILKSWEHLRSYLAYKTEFGSDTKFEQKYTYPEDAVREAILNAIAHRDYSIMNAIEIFIYDDRMEIKNPGALLSTITVDALYELEGMHESRNALIAKVLRENKLMRELGEGMRRIFSLMQQKELQQPTLYSNSSWFKVTLLNKTIFSTKEQTWLKLFENFKLTKKQKQIVLLGIDGKEFSSNDGFKALNISNTQTEQFTKEITKLTRMGIVERFRKQSYVQKIAKRNKQETKDIPKFRIKNPN